MPAKEDKVNFAINFKCVFKPCNGKGFRSGG